MTSAGNAPPRTPGQVRLLQDALRAAAQQHPSRTALVQAETGLRMTYGQAWGITERLASGLATLGVGAGDRVVSLLDNQVESVLLWNACALLGAVETPVNGGYTGDLLAQFLDLSAACVVVVDARYGQQLCAVLHRCPTVRTVVVVGGEAHPVRDGVGSTSWPELLDAGACAPGSPQAALHPHDIACMLFTSGTTGGSSAVLCTFAQEHETAVATPPNLGADDVVYCTSPPNHVGQKLYVYKAILSGCPLVLRRAFSASHFWSDIRTHGCTTTLLLGATAGYLLSAPVRQQDTDNPLSSVMMIPLHPEVLAFRERFGVAVNSMFNMTEICPVAVIHDKDITDHRSAGHVRPGFDWALVDDLDHPVGDGDVGELVLRPPAPWLFSPGYHGNRRKTVETWRNLWFHSGDMFRLDAKGRLCHVDRKRDVIRRRGENVSSSELEREVLRIPGVAECAAVGVESPHTEQDIKVVIVREPGATVDPAESVAELRGRLPAFMVPRFVQFVDSLPKTPTQKVRKSELRGGHAAAEIWDAEAARNEQGASHER